MPRVTDGASFRWLHTDACASHAVFQPTVAAGAMATRTPKTEILMIKDVAEYPKVPERTIYRLAAAKKIPALMVGGSWRFSRADSDEWIAARTAASLAGVLDPEHPVGGTL